MSTVGDVEALVTLISSVFADRPASEHGSCRHEPLGRPEHAILQSA